MHGMLELSHCLTDGDPEAVRRDRNLQCFGFGASVALQAALLASLVIFTVASPAILPMIVPVMAAPFRPTPPTPPRTAGVLDTHGDPVPAGPARPRARSVSHELPSLSDPIPVGIGAGDQIGNVLEAVGTLAPSDSGPARPAEPAHVAPLSVSSGVMEGMLIDRIQPVYPNLAQITHQSGRVELRAIIATDGTVRSVEVVSGKPIFVKAAAEAVLHWRYRPTLLDGAPVEVATFVTVDFVLQ